MPTSAPTIEPTGTAGPYELLEELGRGGMGVVYLARRADGQFRKRVAVKLVRAGMDSEEILARFELERQVLATLEHPGIARLIDGGITDRGRPYLVMELVEGVPIDRWCAEQRLSVDERLELFREVCAAVDSAHRSLVVHRDLKPGNILVTPDGRPKLLDFGIAKVLAPVEGTPNVEATRTESRQLTPGYASPEQVRGDPITTASDAYSLGVILYQLLVGRLPLTPERDSLTAMERAICEEEPPVPSTVEGLSRGLRRKLCGDLDRVLLKALRKEPDRRYSSAAELAADLRRYGAGLPVEARPDTWSYRAERFARRNRGVVSAATLFLLSLVTGLVFSTYQYSRADDAQRKLGLELQIDRERAEKLQQLTVTLDVSRERADAQRELAERRAAELELLTVELQAETERAGLERRRAEDSVAELRQANAELERESEVAREAYDEVWRLARALVLDVRDALSRTTGSTQAMGLVVDLGLKFLDELAANAKYRPGLQQDLVDGYLRLAATLGDIGGPSLGHGAEALELVDEALGLAERLHAGDPTDVERIYALASALNTRGILLSQRGRSSEATEDFRRATELCEAFKEEVPRNVKRIYLLSLSTVNRGQLLVTQGRYAEGLAILEGCVEEVESCARQEPDRSFQLSRLMTTIATVTARMEGPEAAIRALERSREIFQELLEESPGDARYERNLAAAEMILARHYGDVGRIPEAVELVMKRLRENREVLDAEPENAGARSNLIHALQHIGELLARQGKWEELIPYSREGVQLAEELMLLDPTVLGVREMQGRLLIQLGRAESERGELAESEQHLLHAMRCGEELVRLEPEYHSRQVLLYSARANFAQLRLRMAQDVDEPRERRLEWCRDSIEHFRLARELLEDTKGDTTVFGDRETVLSRLRRDENVVVNYRAGLEKISSPADGGN